MAWGYSSVWKNTVSRFQRTRSSISNGTLLRNYWKVQTCSKMVKYFSNQSHLRPSYFNENSKLVNERKRRNSSYPLICRLIQILTRPPWCHQSTGSLLSQKLTLRKSTLVLRKSKSDPTLGSQVETNGGLMLTQDEQISTGSQTLGRDLVRVTWQRRGT